jgi:hypothetical protein
MGYELYGWIERRLGDTWHSVLDIQWLIERRDPLIEYVFGPENPHDPILAYNRGLPPDLSDLARHDLEMNHDRSRMFAASWFAWAEFCALDPDDPCPTAGIRPYRYERTSAGLEQRTELKWEQFERLTAISWDDLWGAVERDRELVGRQWEIAQSVVRIEHPTIRDVQAEDYTGWPAIVAVMDHVAYYRPSDDVRMVIWCIV